MIFMMKRGMWKYFVKGEFLSLGHKLHIYDSKGEEVGLVREKLFQLLPVFEIVIHGQGNGTYPEKTDFS